MLSIIKNFKLFGGRTFKTGIAVFLTALICHLLNLPVVFAVITAIVTIEHTAASSIRKALIRFPASAIGALSAASFFGLLGKAPLTYALAAMVTIAVCHKLKLNDGIVVATLTAVAMIPDLQSNYFVSFFIRLGTTSIGIVVSTLVNFLLLPPDYTPTIYRNSKKLFIETANLFELMTQPLFENDLTNKHKRTVQRRYRQLTTHLEETHQLTQYQREEWKYHRHTKRNMKQFQITQKKLSLLQQIIYHLGNLKYVQFTENQSFSKQEKLQLKSIISSIAVILKTNTHSIPVDHFQLVDELDEAFWHWKEEHVYQSTQYKHRFPPQTIVLYEILCLHDVLEELQNTAQKQKEFKSEL